MARLALQPPALAGMVHRQEGAAQVHTDDGVPVLFAWVNQRLVAQDAVVDQNVEATDRIDGLRNHRRSTCAFGNVCGFEHPLSACRNNLFVDLLACRGIAATTIARGAQIVDDNLRPMLHDQQRVCPTDAAARAGDDRHPTFTEFRECSLGSR